MRIKLREARIFKGVAVKQIAEELAISESFYYKIEQGVRNPTINLAKDIAQLLNSTVDELFFDERLDEPSKETA